MVRDVAEDAEDSARDTYRPPPGAGDEGGGDAYSQATVQRQVPTELLAQAGAALLALRKVRKETGGEDSAAAKRANDAIDALFRPAADSVPEIHVVEDPPPPSDPVDARLNELMLDEPDSSRERLDSLVSSPPTHSNVLARRPRVERASSIPPSLAPESVPPSSERGSLSSIAPAASRLSSSLVFIGALLFVLLAGALTLQMLGLGHWR